MSTPYKQSETKIINRSQIIFAPYNPRKKNPKVVEALKKNFKKVGFMGGIVWNEFTGNLVGGHKRIEALDLIHNYNGESDYEVKIESVYLDEKTEKEQNIFLNNKKVQGEMDYSLLAVMVSEGIEIDNCGLDNNDIQMITAIVPNFEATGENKEIKQAFSAIEKPYEQKKAEIQQLKKDIKNKIFEEQKVTYVTLSFSNWESKAEFMERFGFNSDDIFIKGEIFNDKVERID